ncbi:MAG: mRNA surveillance protein pelota, partial [Candidatus Aminicenantales bacterium]
MKKDLNENIIKLKPETAEDLWHLEKIIRPGDLVSGQTKRKYETESRVERKPVFLTLESEKIEFHKGFEKLRVLGVIKSGKPEEYIDFGTHHSLDIDVGDVISIQKPKGWKKYEIDRVREAQKATRRPKISILVMDEREAELFLIREYGIEEKGRVVFQGGGKDLKESKREEMRKKFFEDIYELIQKIVTEKMIVAGPGFEPENLNEFLKREHPKFASRVMVTHINNTGQQGVYELVGTDAIDKIVREHRFAEETKIVENLMIEISRKNPKAV